MQPTTTDLFDKDIAKRLFTFRTKHIAKQQKKAAELIGISPPWLSFMESGKRRVRMDIVETLVKKFNLNPEWFATGNGPEKLSSPAKVTPATSLNNIHDEVLVIKNMLEMFEANLTHAYKIIENQGKQIETLQKQLDSIKKS